MVAERHVQAYRHDGSFMSAQEREKLLKPYLPPSSSPKPVSRSRRAQPLRGFIKAQLHLFVYTLMHLCFSLFIRIRQAYHVILDRVFAILYYHHRAPELIQKDIRELKKIPQHLSVVLELKAGERGTASTEALLDELAEISAWCACVGIPMLSVYEKTGKKSLRDMEAIILTEVGVLKSYLPTTHQAVATKLRSYFGRQVPSLQIRAPHASSYLNGEPTEVEQPLSQQGHLSVLLLSADDGRSTLVDLTKTLSEMAQRNKISPDDISRDLIDTEISESVMGEPDILILFGPVIELQGYPPWQLRLTEIFHVKDNTGVGYQVFLRGLHSYAKAQMRLGR